MYGHMLLGLKGYTCQTHGKDAWTESCVAAGLDSEEKFFTSEVYNDDVFYRIVDAICRREGVEVDELLYDFGYYNFSVYWHKSKHDTLLYGLSENLHDLMQGLNALHHNLSSKYTEMIAPSFSCERTADGLLVHYYSCRPQLGHYVKGIIVGLAGHMYRLNVAVEILEVNDLGPEMTLKYYHKLSVTLKGERDANTLARLQGCANKKKHSSAKPQQITTLFHIIDADDSLSTPNTPVLPEIQDKDWPITPELFDVIAPFHILFDSQLNITAMGMSFIKLFSNSPTLCKAKEVCLSDLFKVELPTISMSYQAIFKEMAGLFILSVKENVLSHSTSKSLPGFRGQMFPVSYSIGTPILFVASPSANTYAEFERMGFSVTDIGKNDALHELLISNNLYNAQMDLSGQLEKAQHQLEVEKAEVEKAKGYTDNLLQCMLPVQVAHDLKTNGYILPKEFPQVSILFTAISNFQAICKKSTAHEVVVLLNGLFTRFDNLIEIHRVYKVETVGDSYMMTAGFPDTAERHAEAVTNMAFDMRKEITKMNRETPKHSLEIVIGIHSGPVVTGVIGTTQPRYCLFGDTVNTASRMNSTGEPGKIHISESTYEHIKGTDMYSFTNRGGIFVKGLGIRTTYFVEHKGFCPVVPPVQITATSEVSGGDCGLNQMTNPSEPKEEQEEATTTGGEQLLFTKVSSSTSSLSYSGNDSDNLNEKTFMKNGKNSARRTQVQPLSTDRQCTQQVSMKVGRHGIMYTRPIVTNTSITNADHHRKTKASHQCQLL